MGPPCPHLDRPQILVSVIVGWSEVPPLRSNRTVAYSTFAPLPLPGLSSNASTTPHLPVLSWRTRWPRAASPGRIIAVASFLPVALSLRVRRSYQAPRHLYSLLTPHVHPYTHLLAIDRSCSRDHVQAT